MIIPLLLANMPGESHVREIMRLRVHYWGVERVLGLRPMLGASYIPPYYRKSRYDPPRTELERFLFR